MAALGLACENVPVVIGQPWTGTLAGILGHHECLDRILRTRTRA